jgi:hypothetical protein
VLTVAVFTEGSYTGTPLELLPPPLKGLIDEQPDTQVARKITATIGRIAYLVFIVFLKASRLSVLPVSAA